MNPRLARLLVRLYPRPWRERYGAEFEALLEDGSGGFGAAANVAWSALRERVRPARGRDLSQRSYSFGEIAKEPSGFVPVWMSLTALALVLSRVAMDVIQSGHVMREADEGTDAHIWQLLMAAQMPALALFAVKWLPRAPRQTLKMLAVQAGAVMANLAVVFFSGLG